MLKLRHHDLIAERDGVIPIAKDSMRRQATKPEDVGEQGED